MVVTQVVVVVAMLLLQQIQSTTSFSQTPPPRKRYEFRTFDFDSTGICRRPASFQYNPTDDVDGEEETQYFVLRNVPGDGDCVFLAVLSSLFISLGMVNPDAEFSPMMSSMAIEMRNVVANFLSSPEGTLYVNNKPRKRIVRCTDLLKSAAQSEGLSNEEYLIKLRQPGKQGGLYGGGPELTVLSNILRRPISIYHLKQSTNSADSLETEGREIVRMGVFGEGLFEDPGQSIPDGVVSNAIFFTLDSRRLQTANLAEALGSPLKSSWHLHILIADASASEKHACVLLPSVPILHNR